MTASNKPPATPEQEPGFAEGMHRRPWRRHRRGRFSQGLAQRLARWRFPRFSRGMERRPEATGHEEGGRFSEGVEQAPSKK